MAEITAAQVKSLRDETGLPMMECKGALVETNGDREAAKALLQRKYKGKMESRAARETGEGRVSICISDDKKTGAIIDVRCETTPVAGTDQFVALADNLAKSVASQNDPRPTPEAALGFASVDNPGKTLGDEITDVFGLIRENMKLAACRRMEGAYLCGYVHHDFKSGVLISLDAAPDSDEVATDLCHHVTFSNPMAINREDLPAEKIDKVGQLAREIAEGEGKPPQIIEKIVEGKVRAFCAENALMEQEHVKFSKTKVRDVLKKAGVNAVADLVVFKIGA